jgi:glycosyltransferase involved in cell wall biosynthesis
MKPWWKMKLSVLIVTYNNEEFIGKALDSVLMQRTSFDFEIVIGEDFSTDNTRNILREYDKKHPQKFKLLLNQRNIGAHKNIDQTLQVCKGAYIAFLDGDDYWTSPDKLQKQVDYLDIHTECSTCFHDSLIVYKDGSKQPTSYRPSQKPLSTIEDLLFDNFIPTSSVMFRRCVCKKIPEWIGALKMGDWPSHILSAVHGKIGYIDETMAVYVVHNGGVWSTKDWHIHELAIIEMFEALGTHLEAKYTRIISRILRWRYFIVSEKYEKQDDLSNAKNCIRKSLLKHLLIVGELFICCDGFPSMPDFNMPEYLNSLSGAAVIKRYLMLSFPSLYRIIKKILQTSVKGIKSLK